jgi:hypothetical protein
MVNLAWVFFRAHTFDQSLYIFFSFGNLNFDFVSKGLALFADNNQFKEFTISILASFPLFIILEMLINQADFNNLIVTRGIILRWSFYLILAFGILIFGVLNAAPQFIYFQF